MIFEKYYVGFCEHKHDRHDHGGPQISAKYQILTKWYKIFSQKWEQQMKATSKSQLENSLVLFDFSKVHKNYIQQELRVNREKNQESFQSSRESIVSHETTDVSNYGIFMIFCETPCFIPVIFDNMAVIIRYPRACSSSKSATNREFM